ncbi:MAG TPA: hydantoinase/oxoprolinase family protein [Oscillospiraceae bacterium]|nr:hydantoinase/oxoprolinase family protein [Oscillospiraceae bacterium]HPF56356.1 hydantoinase/oxoprolinase family protein [Clostridiales bacterium]HPR74562.1 hydantoinase/oxoprolinase family protein [Oscillospiraceae bacterium]
MNLGLGIDTGGTYTDAVIYDFDSKKVLAKVKTPTTREDLTTCIGAALDKLPQEFLKKLKLVSLSTTLATNACIEDKGCRAKLILMGSTKAVMKWIEADKYYGLRDEDVLCVDTHGSFDGKVIDEPNWDELLELEGQWLSDADALSVVESNAIRNGAVCEKNAKEILGEKYDVPIVLASDLTSGLNVMERGATALLNARLLPVAEEFMDAVGKALKKRGMDLPKMIVRSDGGLMNEHLSRSHPVETILSGPAASVFGGKWLTERDNCLIVDMGGTTTDISVVRNGMPETSGTIRIGNWHTQVKGVFIDTFGLGGDSEITAKDGELVLNARRVMPLCAAAKRWPSITGELWRLKEQKRGSAQPLHEFLYLVKEPQGRNYTDAEWELMELLRAGPVMIGGGKLDPYKLGSERLEAEGIVMRCGFTPTDAMHIKGDFSNFDKQASIMGARYFIDCCSLKRDNEENVEKFADEVYELVAKKLYQNLARVLLTNRYPFLRKSGLGDQLTKLIEENWNNRNIQKADPIFDLVFRSGASLVGIGAPTHLFLPEAAKALGMECVIPENAEVANAIGAVIADISAKVTVEIAPNRTTAGVASYTVHTPKGNTTHGKLEDAIAAAKKAAEKLAVEEARKRGCVGELKVTVESSTGTAFAKSGTEIDLGSLVTAVASGGVEA